MKSNEKRMILILLIILAIAIIIFAVNKNKKADNNENKIEENNVVEEFVEVLEDGTKLNTSTKLHETKNVNGIKIGNIQLTNKNGQSILLADATNETQNSTEEKFVDITLYDKNGGKLGIVKGIIAPLKAGETQQFSVSLQIDYANAYDFEITLK